MIGRRPMAYLFARRLQMSSSGTLRPRRQKRGSP